MCIYTLIGVANAAAKNVVAIPVAPQVEALPEVKTHPYSEDEDTAKEYAEDEKEDEEEESHEDDSHAPQTEFADETEREAVEEEIKADQEAKATATSQADEDIRDDDENNPAELSFDSPTPRPTVCAPCRK